MKISQDTINFNKEILFGELGALIGTQTGGYVSSHFTSSVKIISFSVVIGALIVASLFWMLMRIYDRSRKSAYSKEKLEYDLEYFTPASACLTIFIYYPTLYLTTKHFLEHGRIVEFSAIVAQTIAFAAFIVGINIYRNILFKYYGKKI